MQPEDPTVSNPVDSNDLRFVALEEWLASLPGLGGASLQPASVDASFRRYFRVSVGERTWIAMDAPPPMEDCQPFVEVAGYLASMSLHAPEVVASDVENGFVLMTDLGTRHFLDVLQRDPARADALYEDAMTVLVRMQERGAAVQSRLPQYDEALLRFELSLFHDWLCERHLRLPFSTADEDDWRAVCDALVENALAQPRVFVHRDFHSRNLMVTASGGTGILDFQDAVEGPLTYDLASLLKDCYIRWPDSQVRRWAATYYDMLSDSLRNAMDQDRFQTHFELMGVQRHLKAAGIFARLLLRDGKTGYLKDVPRTLAYIVDVAPRYPILANLSRLITERCLPQLESAS